MQGIKIINQKIANHISSKILPEGYIQLPDRNQVIVGKETKYYDNNWMLKPIQKQVDEGIITLTENQIVENNEVKTLSDNEMIERGLKELPTGYKLIEGKLTAKTVDEQYSDADITLEAYNQIKLNKLRAIRQDLLFLYSNPLNMQKMSEDRLVIAGELTEGGRKITDAVLIWWDRKFQEWRDLPETINITQYTLDEIHFGNTAIWGVIPGNDKIWMVQ